MSSSSPAPAVPALAAPTPLYSGLTAGQIQITDPLTQALNVLAANLQNVSDFAYAYAANGSQQSASNNINTLSNRIDVNKTAIANLGSSTQASIAQLAGNVGSTFTVSNTVQANLGSNVSTLQAGLLTLASNTAQSFNVLAQEAALSAAQSNSYQAGLGANIGVLQSNVAALGAALPHWHRRLPKAYKHWLHRLRLPSWPATWFKRLWVATSPHSKATCLRWPHS